MKASLINTENGYIKHDFFNSATNVDTETRFKALTLKITIANLSTYNCLMVSQTQRLTNTLENLHTGQKEGFLQ